MAGPTRFVGARVKRAEDPRFLLGRAHYVGDITAPHMVEMTLVRSPYAHARIKTIDTTAAQAVSGVCAVLTGADLREKIRPLRPELNRELNPGFKTCDWYGLTSDKARHVGDPVALVVATTRYIAEDAMDLVAVDYEPLDPVVDPERALSDSSSLVHEEWHDNVQCQTDFVAGDPDAAFATAHTVVRERFRTNRHHALPLEPRGCLATVDRATGDFTLWTSSQMPHFVRSLLAELLDYSENRIRVIAPDVGGGFGLKGNFFVEEALTAVAAMHVQRPVRWLEDRRESFLASPHAKDQIVDAELAFDATGKILAGRVRGIGDVGAYNASPWTSGFEVIHMAQTFPGPYRIQDYSFSTTAVATNKSTVSTFRGVGLPIATFVREGLLDRAARELNIDPAEIRRRNIIRNEEFPYQSVVGMTYEPGGYLECLEKAVEMVDYAGFRQQQASLQKQGIYRGIGICCYNEATALGSIAFHFIGMPISSYEAANIKFDPSGHITVFCGTHSHGQSHETVYAQIAADELGLTPDRITVRLGDTAETPYGWGSWASRSAVTGGGAVLNASRTLAAKMCRIAGHFLEVSADDIELVDGAARVKGAPTRMLTIAELAKRVIFTDASQLPAGDQPGLEATHYYDPPAATFASATHAAVVEVDAHTGALKILRYIVVEDCGRMINPMVVEGQICGGVAHGLGGALLEHLVYDENGQLLSTSLMDYLIPTATDVPTIEIGHVETPSLSDGGFKGAGEGGAIAPFATIASAVADALSPFGPNVTQLPLSPERVREFVQANHVRAA